MVATLFTGSLLKSVGSSLYDSVRNGMVQGLDYMQARFGGEYNEVMAAQVDYVMNDPRKTRDEIKDLLENIKPDVDLPPESREGTPDALKYPLVSAVNVIAGIWLTLRSMNIKRLL
jgi:hypothetical protein